MAEKKPTARELRTRKASPLVLEWGETLTNQNAWPEGKSIAGFEKWLRSQFYQAAKEARATGQKLNIPHDAGHASIGADVLSNLAPQIRFGKDSNQTTIDKTTGEVISSNLEHVRLRKDLMDVDADFALSQAFEQYLNMGEIEPGSQLNLADFAAEYRTKILHDADYAPTALAAESRAQLERLEEAYKEQAGFFPEPEMTDAVDQSGPVKIVQEGDPNLSATVISPADPPENPYPSKRKVLTNLSRRMGHINLAVDRAQTAEYLFKQGQTGSDLDQLTQQASESGMFEATVGNTAIGRNDPTTDVGKRTLEIMSDPETGRRLDEQRFVRGSEKY